MNQLSVVIVDDEPAAIAVIKALLEQFAPDMVIAGSAMDGLEAIRVITREKPDLVFLDVNMPVLNGVQILERLAGMTFRVIFTTGTTEYALKAIKLKAADYLLKPIDPAEFIIALSGVRDGAASGPPLAAGGKRLQFSSQHATFFLQEAEISHVAGMGSYCQIHTVGGEKIVVSKNIGQIEQKLSPALFFRSHNSFIINLDYVSKYLHRDGYYVEMKNGSVIEVSRRSRERLLQALAARTV